MSRGGARKGAGRKSNAELAAVRARIARAVSEQDWITIYQNLANIAMQDKDKRAAVLALKELRETRFGLPTHLGEGDRDADVEPINFVKTYAQTSIGDSEREIEIPPAPGPAARR